MCFMHQYIKDTKHCTEELIRLIFEEEKAHKKASAERSEMSSKRDFYYKEYIAKDMHEDFNEMQVMHDFNQMANANGKAENLKIEIDKLQKSIDAKDFSLRSLCGALLQIAKQGISIVHVDLNTCPDGRTIGPETLKNIIWQSRNQSMHFEEGNPHPPVCACFKKLELAFGKDFSLSAVPPENLARRVVKLLGWDAYDKYEADMVSILG